ncbi:hypothetical protein LCGC14_2592920 [marine sediment metagenome]|uniref:DUF4870 domain-containing protein n=1 Tax=marine sediment metagenome TaxID=412755 RepID=A0A0F9CM78_9ZZZZ
MEEEKHESKPEENNEAKPEEKTPSEPAKTAASSETETIGTKVDAETSSGLEPNLAALLAYLFGWISGLIFYLIETKNKYVRFHALQSILFSIAYFVVFFVIGTIFSVLGSMPGAGLLFASLGGLFSMVFGIGFFVVWIMLMVKAYKGEKWLLPIIGDIAEKNA